MAKTVPFLAVLRCIDGAKVPIVKCVDEITQVSVDVSFDVPNGPMNVPKIKVR